MHERQIPTRGRRFDRAGARAWMSDATLPTGRLQEGPTGQDGRLVLIYPLQFMLPLLAAQVTQQAVVA